MSNASNEDNPSDSLVIKEPKKKKFGILKKIILAFVLFIAVLAGFTYFTTAGAKKVADEFVGYIQNVDSNSAYDLLSTSGMESGSREDFAALINQIGPILNGQVSSDGVGVSAGSGQETVSTINYKIPGSDGITYAIEVNLVKEDGSWKVKDFTSDSSP